MALNSHLQKRLLTELHAPGGSEELEDSLLVMRDLNVIQTPQKGQLFSAFMDVSVEGVVVDGTSVLDLYPFPGLLIEELQHQ